MKRSTKRKATPARSKRSPAPARATKAARKAAPTDTVDAMVAANAPTLGLILEPAWQAGVAFNLRLILRFGALVDAFELPDDAEPAPVFHA